MKIFKFIAIILLIISSERIYAQKTISISSKITNSENKIIFAKLEDKENLYSSPTNDKLLIKQLTNYSDNVDYKFERVYSDNFGLNHKVYNAFLNGIKVLGLDYVIHEKAGKIIMLNGQFSDVSTVTTTPTLSREMAMKKASIFFERDNNIPNIKSENQGLVVCKDLLQGSNKFKTAFKILVKTHDIRDEKYIYLDAQTGQVIQFENLTCSVNAVGAAQTRFSGIQSFTTDFTGSNYRLREVRNGVNILTLSKNSTPEEGSTNSTPGTDIFDNDNNWTWPEQSYFRCETDAHWGAEKVNDYPQLGAN